jgi:glycosyltransferase involved in cell wall biosynthesis
MRILYHHRTRADDGQAVHIRSLQKAFRDAGHEVLEVGLVKQGEGDPVSDSGQPDKPDKEQDGQEEQGSGWNWVSRLPRFLLELAEFGYSALARRRILKEAGIFKPDFIYERYAFGNAGGLLAAARLGLPFILEVNSPMVDELSKTRGLTLKRAARRMELAIFRGATRVCVVTRVLGDILVDMGVDPDRIVVTPNGVHPELFDYDRLDGRGACRRRSRLDLGLSPEPVSKELVVGFVGYFRDWHRLDLVIEMLAKQGLEKLHFVIIGEGPAGEELMALSAKLGLERRVHFPGPRRHQHIPELLTSFDIALMPAINAYASALKLHEYMAAGLPVIAPDQPNLYEVVAHNQSALLIPPGDSAALEQAVRRLATDPDLRGKLGANAQAQITKLGLTWSANADLVTNIATDLIREKS